MSIVFHLRRIGLGACVLFVGQSVEALGPRVDYSRDIRPILADNCFQCHGADAKAREADLRLDTREGLFSKIDDIFPVLPGNPEKSEVMLRILSDDKDEKMPPP